MDLQRLAQALCAESSDVRSVAASFREAGAATVLGTGHVLLSGDPVAAHRLQNDGPYHLAAHGAFTQAHIGQANAAHGRIERVLKELGVTRVLELYAGSGALALRLAAAGFSVTAVEAFGPAVVHVDRAAREQKLTLKTVNGPAERVLGELGAKNERFQALIVNPPRRGLSSEVRRRASLLEPSAILYMSCDPATLARDLGHLSELGYAARELWPFDMIPHSSAVECLVALRRGAPPAPKVAARKRALVGRTEVRLRAGQPGRGLRAQPAKPRAAAARRKRSRAALLAAARSRQQWRVPVRPPRSRATRTRAGIPQRHAELRDVVSRRDPQARGASADRCEKAGRVVSASTRYLRESVQGGHSLLTVWPEQAGPPQLRQLLLGVGHALLGDTRFGDPASNTYFEHRHGLDRSFLHCSAVTLVSASSHVTCEAPLPGELKAVLASLSEQTATPS
ncbi:MAG: hypothetical protein WDO74_36980 [Pseudomonadota bacterium]